MVLVVQEEVIKPESSLTKEAGRDGATATTTLTSEISFLMSKPFTSVPELEIGWSLGGVIFQALAGTSLWHLIVWFSCLIASSYVKAKALLPVLGDLSDQ